MGRRVFKGGLVGKRKFLLTFVLLYCKAQDTFLVFFIVMKQDIGILGTLCMTRKTVWGGRVRL